MNDIIDFLPSYPYINQANFYQSIVEKKEFFERNKIHSMLFNDHRISLVDDGIYYFTIVTLELDSASPKIYVDRFNTPYRQSIWYYELKAADELKIGYLVLHDF